MQKISTSVTRQHLLDYGIAIVREAGVRGLTVRGLCQRAGVNPGSFVYHFGNREQYVSALMEHWYTPLMQQVQMEYNQLGTPVVRLKAMLHQLVTYLGTHGELIAQIAMDASAGESLVIAFVKTLTPRHPRLLLQCIIEAQQSGDLVRADPPHQMMFLMSAVGVPVLIQHLFGDREVLPEVIRDAFSTYAADPRYIEQRLQWALRGLSPQEKTG